jgi:hypothetical protein
MPPSISHTPLIYIKFGWMRKTLWHDNQIELRFEEMQHTSTNEQSCQREPYDPFPI